MHSMVSSHVLSLCSPPFILLVFIVAHSHVRVHTKLIYLYCRVHVISSSNDSSSDESQSDLDVLTLKKPTIPITNSLLHPLVYSRRNAVLNVTGKDDLYHDNPKLPHTTGDWVLMILSMRFLIQRWMRRRCAICNQSMSRTMLCLLSSLES